MRYVAFLRGVNVGKSRRMTMEDLRAVFKAMAFEDVTTVLAAGTVAFDAPKATAAALEGQIEAALREAFGSEIGVIVRTIADIRAMVAAEPFAGVEVTKDTRLNVTFLKERPTEAQKLFAPGGEGVTVAGITDGEVFTALTLGGGAGTADAMRAIERVFGRGVTTRTWKTVVLVAGVS